MAVGLGIGLACGSHGTARSQEAVAPANPQATGGSATQSAAVRPTTPDHVRPQAYRPQRRRSIVHHYQYPYPGYYQGDETAGFRNPGGVGRHAEYYPPGDQFQVQGDPVRVAQFGVGGYPSRAEQMQAESLGNQRYNSIQQHMDNYSRPSWGYGWGVGGFGGFW
jgi:hypothetical protein